MTSLLTSIRERGFTRLRHEDWGQQFACGDIKVLGDLFDLFQGERRFAAEPALDRLQGDARCRRKDLDALASGSEQRPDIRYGEFVET